MTDNNDIDELIRELRELRVRTAHVINRLEAARNRNRATGAAETTPPLPLRVFAVGDRVQIDNEIRQPKNWPNNIRWDPFAARKATVTKVTGDRVHFVDDTGNRTWRLPSNLSHLQP
jgi:hypothetical protein